MSDDPIELFKQEFARASQSESFDAARCALATADLQGRPSVRFVLCKQVDVRGFVFYTNRESQKGRELDQNPEAALAFHWSSIGVQVRVEGPVSLVSNEEADAYFATRELDSQLGAWASNQSRPLVSREHLEKSVEELAQRYKGQKVPRPPFWIGYRIAPQRIEFWYNRDARLHDRVVYERAGGAWVRAALYP